MGQNLSNPIAKTVLGIRTFSGYSRNELQHVEKDARPIAPESGKPSLEFIAAVMPISLGHCSLDRVATHILAFGGNSQATFFDGNYQEYEAGKETRLGEEVAKSKRIRYKPLRG